MPTENEQVIEVLNDIHSTLTILVELMKELIKEIREIE